MTTDQAAARADMITLFQRTYNTTETAAARLVDIGLDAERNNQPPWPAIHRAVRDAAERGEDWAVEARNIGRN